MGICGTGVGSLAGLLKSQGYDVVGSDTNIYPPMSTQLDSWGISVLPGWKVENLSCAPDLVIIGNVIRESNPVARYVRDQGIPYMSMPQALAEFGIQDKHSIVVAGTHGKTTTTALVAHFGHDKWTNPYTPANPGVVSGAGAKGQVGLTSTATSITLTTDPDGVAANKLTNVLTKE